MKPAFIVVAHQSEEFRPNGDELLFEYMNSLAQVMYPKAPRNGDYDVFIIDNGSSLLFTGGLFCTNQYHFYHLPDQNRGLAHAWNLGVQLALLNGNDFICITSDDLIYNETLPKFFEQINLLPSEIQDNAVFGTLCDAPRTFPYQQAQAPTNVVRDITNLPDIHVIHGWFMAFSKKYFDTYNVGGHIFDPAKKWRDQEQFQNRDQERGAKSIVIGHTLIHHKHIGGWGKVMEAERAKNIV